MDQQAIPHENFKAIFSVRVQPLLNIIRCLANKQPTCKCFNRLVLRSLLSESTQIEEFLDFYGAKNNCQWGPFRSLIATVKLFSDICYELLHIQHSIPIYRLLPIGFQFTDATKLAFMFSANILLKISPMLLEKAHELGLHVPQDWEHQCSQYKEPPMGRLAQDRDRGTFHSETAAKTVTSLATEFLNLSVEGEILHVLCRTKPEEYELCMKNSISEKKLRSLELKFHNLQSLYDTYVSDTDLDSLDTSLPVLRGHISVVFHLLKTATGFAHYYERHVERHILNETDGSEPLVDGIELLKVLIGYSISFASRYIERAKELCREMLKNYAEIDTIEVPVPQYRGFHVRPSTLVSKIVLHYGNEVTMRLCEETYDASSPLELFRANEKMNAMKRRQINQEIACTGIVPNCNGDGVDIKSIVRDVILKLASKNKLFLYEQQLTLREELEHSEGTLIDKVIEEIARLMAMGKIDIETSLKATFTGDKRVLADIQLLADCGYGEDKFGNNILLPEKLVYLRR